MTFNYIFAVHMDIFEYERYKSAPRNLTFKRQTGVSVFLDLMICRCTSKYFLSFVLCVHTHQRTPHTNPGIRGAALG